MTSNQQVSDLVHNLLMGVFFLKKRLFVIKAGDYTVYVIAWQNFVNIAWINS